MDNPNHLIPTTITRLLRDEPLALTRAEQRWDYLHVEDAAEALCATASSSGAEGVFVLGSGEANPIRGIVEYIRDQINPSRLLEFGGVACEPDQIMQLQADVSRMKTFTGWSPRTSLHSGLNDTIAWYRKYH